MIINPIIPIWLMLIIGIILLIFTIKTKDFLIDILIIALLFMINLRIMIPSNSGKSIKNNLDVLFVIDNSISMIAEDYQGNNTRLSGLKQDCEYIINNLNGARFSVITFNNTAKVVMPFTSDANLTIDSIDILIPISRLNAKGSSLNSPHEIMEASLKLARQKNDNQKIVFFLSDGEITNDESLKSYRDLRKYINNGAVLGYGTSQGGYMKNSGTYAENEPYLMDYDDYNYEKAISKIDEKNLKKIAKDLKIDYINMNNQNNIDKKLKEIQNTTVSNIENNNMANYNDTYYFLIFPLLVLLIIKFNYLRRLS